MASSAIRFMVGRGTKWRSFCLRLFPPSLASHDKVWLGALFCSTPEFPGTRMSWINYKLFKTLKTRFLRLKENTASRDPATLDSLPGAFSTVAP